MIESPLVPESIPAMVTTRVWFAPAVSGPYAASAGGSCAVSLESVLFDFWGKSSQSLARTQSALDAFLHHRTESKVD
eukprot:5047827-Pyramimonas_sp.AAC.1